jgi:hypothetical protein
MHVLDEPYAVGVIVRMSERSVRPGMLSAFRAAVLDEVRTYPGVHAGLLSDEVLVLTMPDRS